MNKITFIVKNHMVDAKIIVEDDWSEADGVNREEHINTWKHAIAHVYGAGRITSKDVFIKAEEMTRNDVIDALMEGDAENPDTIREYLREGFLGYEGMKSFGLEGAYKKAFGKRIKIIN